MRINLETERLRLRNLTPDDYQTAFLWCGDPDVARFMVYPVYTKAEDVRAWIETLDPDDPDEYEAGIELKSTGELIGSGGIYYKPDMDLWNIGYNLRKDQWGHGYAVEMIRGLIEYAKGRREIRGITGTFANENSRSRRVMEKLGMTYLEDVTMTKLDGSASYPGKRYRRLFDEPQEAAGEPERASAADADTVAELACELWPDHTAEEMKAEYRALLADPEAAVFLLRLEGKAAGFAQCQLRHDYVEGTETSPVGYLEGIYVRESARGKGFARRLLQACENWAREKGCAEFASDCELTNTVSQRFHEAVGFEEANRLVAYVRKL